MAQPQEIYGPASSILITGASSGIGEYLAVHLARYGAKLALLARRESELQRVAQRVREAGGQPLTVVHDVSDHASVAKVHNQVIDQQGPVDVAFLNAGIDFPTSIKRFDAAQIRRIFEVNVFGVCYWIEALLPRMVQRGHGTLVGVSSLAALRGFPGHSAYAASKAALSSFLESLRVETPDAIQVTIVEPGFVRSPMTDKNRGRIRMPFIMETDQAASIIADQVAEGRRVIRFPWQLAAAVRVFSNLPNPIYDRIGKVMISRR